MSTRPHTALILLSGLIAMAAPAALGLPAFPGAEGFGTQTPGGRGGRVIAVTSLDDSGPGTLREAVTATGARTIIFRVGGEIRLKSHLAITEPFVTLAGQTAPGDGILLRDASLYIQTHDVVVRFIRCRVGAVLNEKLNSLDGLHIGEGDIHNVVVDHCSFSWSIDEAASVRRPAHDVTLSWNIISEGLRRPFTREQIGEDRSHSMALLLGGGPDRCTLHHNLLALCNSRNPRIQGGRHAFINNVVYGWGSITGMFSRNPEVNFIGNYYKPGPYSRPLKAISEGKEEDIGRIYAQGNLGPLRPDHALPDWELTVNVSAEKHRAAGPFEMAPLRITSAEEAYAAVLSEAGAILPARDSVDRRVVRSARLSLGAIIDRPDEVGGYPAMKNGTSPADSDGDGMPDDWERAQGFDPADPKDGPADADRDGYTNLEQYLNDQVHDGLMQRVEINSMLVENPETVGGPIEVTAGAVALPLAMVPGTPRTYYAHAWIHGETPVTIHTQMGETMTLLPARYRDLVSAGPGMLTFMAREPGPRVVAMGSSPMAPRLFLFIDPFPAEADFPEGAVVFDARPYGVMYGRSNATSRLQTALDACAKAGGGIVYVPTGEHEISSVRIPPRVTLHLDRTAVLYSIAGADDAAAIVIDDAEGAGLAGPGTIDGRGSAGVRRSPLVLARRARGLRIRDLMVRDPAGPGVALENCEDAILSGVKIIVTASRPDVGGLAINGGRQVSCERCFFSSSGTALNIQSSGKTDAAPVDNVLIRESVLFANGVGLSVGPDNVSKIRNIRAEAVDVAGANAGISVFQRPGAGMTGMTFRNMTLCLTTPPDDAGGCRPIQVISFAPEAETALSDLLFENIEANAQGESLIAARGRAMLENLRLFNVRVRAEKRSSDPGATTIPSVFHLVRIRNGVIRGLDVEWPDEREKSWAGEIDADQVENLDHRPVEPSRPAATATAG